MLGLRSSALVPGAASFDGLPFITLCAPVGHCDLPSLSFFDDQQVYPLVPTLIAFSFSNYFSCHSFWNLISFVLTTCHPLLSLSTPFPSFLWHHAAIHLIDRRYRHKKLLYCQLPTLSFEEQPRRSIRLLDIRKPRSNDPVIPSTYLL